MIQPTLDQPFGGCPQIPRGNSSYLTPMSRISVFYSVYLFVHNIRVRKITVIIYNILEFNASV